MEKRVWTKPQAKAEQFMANEYVAACYYIDCDLAPGNDQYGMYHTESSGNRSGCGNELNQAITIHSGDINTGAVISITELDAVVNGQSVGDLPCYFTTAGSRNPGSERITAKVGDVIYWVTDVDYRPNNTNWMLHSGKIELTNPSRPNHS